MAESTWKSGQPCLRCSRCCSVVDGFTDALAPVFAVPVWFAVPEAVLLAVPCVFRVPLALLLALGALPLTPALAVPVWLLTLPLAVADGDVELL